MLASSFRQVCLPQHCRLTDERENPTGVEDNISESSQAMISKGQKQQRFGRKPGERASLPSFDRATEENSRVVIGINRVLSKSSASSCLPYR